MRCRKADLRDIPALTILMGQLGYPTTEDKMTTRFNALEAHPSYATLVVEMDGVVVGMVGLCLSLFYEQDGCYARVAAFVVDVNYRRKGIGNRLLEAAEEWAKGQGASVITLNSGNREERNAAHHFYSENGYVGRSTGFSKRLI